MALAAKCSALRVPSQFFTGCGSFQRKSPTGGWAKGMPLNILIPETWVPSTNPLTVLTVGRPLSDVSCADKIVVHKMKQNIKAIDFICRIVSEDKEGKFGNEYHSYFQFSKFSNFQTGLVASAPRDSRFHTLASCL